LPLLLVAGIDRLYYFSLHCTPPFVHRLLILVLAGDSPVCFLEPKVD